MAVAMFMHWPGVTSDQYDAVMARLGLDANPPAGGILHVAAVTDEGVDDLRPFDAGDYARALLAA